MNRIYAPLPSDHPGVGVECPRCGVAFVAGDRTSLVGVERPAFEGATVEAALVHAGCLNESERVDVPCEVCGEEASAQKGGCTNRRCQKCHMRWCTPGGATEPGHGRRWPDNRRGKEDA